MTTKNEVEAVVEALVEIIDSWNDAAADEDRGRSNDAICLTLWDDGSGRIGRRSGGCKDVDDWHDFDNLEGLIKVLQKEGVEIAEPSVLYEQLQATTERAEAWKELYRLRGKLLNEKRLTMEECKRRDALRERLGES